MLFFGVLTLFPKAYFEVRAKKMRKAAVSAFLGCCSLFFSIMAFYYAWLLLSLDMLGR